MVITAFPVGFFAGLFGIGGGLITVPFLFFIFDSLYINQDYFMRVSDVEDAFMLIPLHPDVWLYMLFRWSIEGPDAPEQLLMHLFGDFGTRGMPGTFQLFLVRVVVQMARSELILTLPMTIFVDDAGLIGPQADQADDEMVLFQDWYRPNRLR